MHHHVHIQTLWREEIAPPTELLPIRDNLETVVYLTLNSDIQKHFYERIKHMTAEISSPQASLHSQKHMIRKCIVTSRIENRLPCLSYWHEFFAHYNKLLHLLKRKERLQDEASGIPEQRSTSCWSTNLPADAESVRVLQQKGPPQNST